MAEPAVDADAAPVREEVLAHAQSEAEGYLRTSVRYVLTRMSPKDIIRVVTEEANASGR